ncbi:hypothetical protein RHI9324_02570 [Rhizobium sp. CECT 9324]|nr:hypothetical protein RHI9324_02570 [Rhizobium sp. CECT 9324]
MGILALALVYRNLAVRTPALTAGPYAYAKAGFGPFIGFNSAWGYWISAWIGNVSYAVVLFSATSYFVPSFGEGNILSAIHGHSSIENSPKCNLHELFREGKTGDSDQVTRHGRHRRSVHLLTHSARSGKRFRNIKNIKCLLDHVIEGRPKPGQQLDRIDISLPDLRLHGGEIGGLAMRIQNGWRDQISLSIVTELAGEVDGVLDLNRLRVAKQGFPCDAEILDPSFVVRSLHSLDPFIQNMPAGTPAVSVTDQVQVKINALAMSCKTLQNGGNPARIENASLEFQSRY